MSAMTSTSISRVEPDPNGDRVRIVMTGKFLKYKKT